MVWVVLEKVLFRITGMITGSSAKLLACLAISEAARGGGGVVSHQCTNQCINTSVSYIHPLSPAQ